MFPLLGLMLLSLSACDGGGGERTGRIPEDNCCDYPQERVVSFEPVDIEMLTQGTQPTIGNTGPKQFLWIRDEAQFASAWFDYATDDLPQVDFARNEVLLYDRGTSDISICGPMARLQSVSAKSAEYDFPWGTYPVTVFAAVLDNSPSLAMCLPGIDSGRPYFFASVPAHGTYVSELLMSWGAAPASSREIGVSVFANGGHPVSGDQGPRRVVVVHNASDFERLWSEYKSTTVPEFDFSNSTAVLYDWGTSFLSTCGGGYYIASRSASRLEDEPGVIALRLRFANSCPIPDIACPADVVEGRRFEFMAVDHPYDPVTSDFLVSEEFRYVDCAG